MKVKKRENIILEYQQTRKSKVEQICVLENGKAVVKTLGCIFVHKGYNTLFLKPGTYTIWNQQIDGLAIGVICRQPKNDGMPSLETFRIEDIISKVNGLQYDHHVVDKKKLVEDFHIFL
ncbi:hypothetical protein WUBG_15173 [Wuchereria bancrofti]|uniref:Uncharacterized protein n=1 Tax=Wuchereria bancrofti TaxID=6293 RepID=J9AIB0_WUCBA|nr:hypothetical protein WUBG_15173 [Wuchereria bancrofti]